MDNNDNLLLLDEVALNDSLLLVQSRITTLRDRRLGYAITPRRLNAAIESLIVIETKILKILKMLEG